LSEAPIEVKIKVIRNLGKGTTNEEKYRSVADDIEASAVVYTKQVTQVLRSGLIGNPKIEPGLASRARQKAFHDTPWEFRKKLPDRSAYFTWKSL
jgi:hypothetical protein